MSTPSAPAPLLLALDGSAPRFSLALADRNGHLLGEALLDQAAASRTLFAALDRLLADSGAKRGDLGGIVATRGPGSFTGVRLALSAALGLSLSLAAEAAGVGSLEAVAECAPLDADPGGLVIAAIDALRGEWFVQTFAGPERQPLAQPARALEEDLPASGLLVGFGVARLESRASFTPTHGLAAAALRAFVRRGGTWDRQQLSQPIYLREAATSNARRGGSPS